MAQPKCAPVGEKTYVVGTGTCRNCDGPLLRVEFPEALYGSSVAWWHAEAETEAERRKRDGGDWAVARVGTCEDLTGKELYEEYLKKRDLPIPVADSS
jgi:hypothetical protein